MTVTSSERPRGGSGAMFDRIAGRYDLLNRVLSLGIDRRWRRRMVASLGLEPGHRVLDLATGTADVALEVLRQAPRATVVGLDPAPRMLDIGRAKVARAGLGEAIVLRLGDAQQLPFEDRSFDAVTIAFGIRNVADREAALREMARVTRPGGRIAILELNEPRRGLLAPLARFHIHTVVPRLGAWLAGATEYDYLQGSIAAFPPPEAFAAAMAECGLRVLERTLLTLGVSCLFVAQPEAAS